MLFMDLPANQSRKLYRYSTLKLLSNPEKLRQWYLPKSVVFLDVLHSTFQLQYLVRNFSPAFVKYWLYITTASFLLDNEINICNGRDTRTRTEWWPELWRNNKIYITSARLTSKEKLIITLDELGLGRLDFRKKDL